MRLKNQQPPGRFGKQLQILLGSIEVVEEATTKDGIERAVLPHVPRIVAHELQVRQSGVRLHEFTCGDVRFAHVQAEGSKAHAGEFRGVAAFQTAEIGDAVLRFIAGEDRIEDTFGGEEPRMAIHGGATAGPGFAAVRQSDIVLNEFDGHPCTLSHVRIGGVSSAGNMTNLGGVRKGSP